MSGRLQEALKLFFDENDFSLIADRIDVIRYDGISFYSNKEFEFHSASTQALVGGLWQAATSLSSLVKQESEFMDFRLSFDDASHGIYVLPLIISGDEFYLSAIFKDAQNPGKLKRDIRLLKENIMTYCQGLEILQETQIYTSDRSGYLFSEITDEEMDQLFDFEKKSRTCHL